MSINEIVRLWKADEDGLDRHMPQNPAGQELSEEELEEVIGGASCGDTCVDTCMVTCGGQPTCPYTN